MEATFEAAIFWRYLMPEVFLLAVVPFALHRVSEPDSSDRSRVLGTSALALLVLVTCGMGGCLALGGAISIHTTETITDRMFSAELLVGAAILPALSVLATRRGIGSLGLWVLSLGLFYAGLWFALGAYPAEGGWQVTLVAGILGALAGDIVAFFRVGSLAHDERVLTIFLWAGVCGLAAAFGHLAGNWAAAWSYQRWDGGYRSPFPGNPTGTLLLVATALLAWLALVAVAAVGTGFLRAGMPVRVMALAGGLLPVAVWALAMPSLVSVLGPRYVTRYVEPFAALSVEGAYGGDVAPEGYPGSGLFSPDGQYLVSAVHQGDVVHELEYPSALVVWRTSDWHRVLTRTLELGYPTLAFSPDSKTLAIGSSGGTVALYTTSDWTVLRTLRVEPKQVRVAFLPDGSALASASGDTETLRFWRTSDWSELRTLQIEGLCAYCYVKFSPDGRLFTAELNDRRVVNVWRVEDGSIDRTFRLPRGVLASWPSFSRDGSVVKASAVVGTQPYESVKTVRYLWRVEDGQLISEDPDRGMLVGRGGEIWRIGETTAAFALQKGSDADQSDTGTFGAFSPNGTLVVGTCNVRLLCLWRLP